jgi:hypothetical protein
MTAVVVPRPCAFCRITNGTHSPVIPKATHCAAIHALFVQTWPVNEAAGFEL